MKKYDKPHLRLRREWLQTYIDSRLDLTYSAICRAGGLDHAFFTRMMQGKREPGNAAITTLLLAFPELDFKDLFEVVIPEGWRREEEPCAAKSKASLA